MSLSSDLIEFRLLLSSLSLFIETRFSKESSSMLSKESKEYSDIATRFLSDAEKVIKYAQSMC